MKKYLFLILLITGCASYKKQQQRAEQYYSQYPNELAKLCALKFPVVGGYRVGHDTILEVDTITQAVNCPPAVKPQTVFIKVPSEVRLRVDTIIKRDMRAEDSLRAGLVALGQNNSNLSKQIDTLSKQSRDRLIRIIVVSVIGVCILILFLWDFFSLKKLL